MSESHVVTGLVAKRAELAGQIEQCYRELERLVANVSYLDGSIKLFAPDYKLDRIRAKTPRRRNQFFHQGECQCLVLEIFRDAEEPLSAHQIAGALVERKELEATPAIILESAVGRVEGCFHWGAEQGARTRNSYSIPRSCNAALRRSGRAIQPVA